MFLLLGPLLIIFVVLIGLYVGVGILLYSYNKRMYGKGTALAWIPGLQIYLLGKYALNEVFGIVLLFAFFFFCISFEFATTKGVIKYPPYDIPYVSTVVSIIILLCLIITIINFIKLKKGTKQTQLQIEEKKKEEEIKNQATPEEKVVTAAVIKEESAKAMQTYDAAFASTQNVQDTPSVVDQTPKIPCPKCGVQIRSDVTTCPFCGQQTK